MSQLRPQAWWLQGWFLALIAASLWAFAYVWYVKWGSRPIADLWRVPLKKRRDARTVAAQEAARDARQAEQRRLELGKIDTAAAVRDATDLAEH